MFRKTILLVLLCFCILLTTSCSKKTMELGLSVSTDSVDLENHNSSKWSDILVKCTTRKNIYYSRIQTISGNETVSIPKAAFFNKYNNTLPTDDKIEKIELFTGTASTESLVFSWDYTPIAAKNPSGFIFSGLETIQFLKYSGQSKFIVTNQTINKDHIFSGNYVYENGKITLHCGSNTWEGYFEDDELVLHYSGVVAENEEILNTFKTERYYSLLKTTYFDNVLPTENVATYEDSILLVLVQNFKDEELLTEYAKIFHSAEYELIADDDFAWHDKKEEYQNEIIDKLDSIPTNFTTRLEWKLSEYDFDKKCFTLDFSKITEIPEEVVCYYSDIKNPDALNMAYLETNYSKIWHSINIAKKMLNRLMNITFFNPLKIEIPLESDEAKAFLDARKDTEGKTDRSVICVIYYNTPTTYLDTKNIPNTLLPTEKHDIIGNWMKIEVYDPIDMSLLYTNNRM